MVEVAGVESSAPHSEGVNYQSGCECPLEQWTQIWTQISGKDRQGLTQLVESWSSLSPQLKAAVLAIVGTSEGGSE